MALQNIRSNTASKRPLASGLSDGQIAVNTNETSPGLFFKGADGAVLKVGPVHIGNTAPNSSPATGGSTGNSVGEQWLDTSNSGFVFKIWDGTDWRSETGQFVDVAGDTMTGDLTISSADLVMDDGEIIAASGDEATPSITFEGDLDTGFHKPAADKLAISTGGTSRVIIDDSGRVGIGTTAPDELLHIEGNLAEFKGTNKNPIDVSAGTEQIFKFGIEGQKNNVYGPAGSIIFRQDNSTWSSVEPNYKPTRIELCTQDNTTTDFSETPRLVVDQNGNIGIGTTDPDTVLDVRGGVFAANQDIGIQLGVPTGEFKSGFKLKTNGLGVPRVAIEAASNSSGGSEEYLSITNLGRVGIGTTDPGYKLQISEASTSSVSIKSSGDNTSPRASRLIYSFDDGDGASINATRATSDTAADVNLSFRTGGITNSDERARIDSVGRLLVGTSTSQSVARNFGAISPSNIQVVLSTTFAAYSAICKKNDTSGPVLALASSRSDSIVNQDDRLGEIRFAGYDGTDYESSAALIKAEVDGTPGASDMPGRLVFSTTADGASNPTERMRITSDGLVGIGTTAPDELLHIKGNVAEFKGTNTNSINATAETEQVFKFGIEGQKNNVYGPAGSIIFRQDNSSWSSAESNFKPTRIELCTQDGTTTDTSETPRLVVDQNGNIGIGKTDPGATLHVNSAGQSTSNIDTTTSIQQIISDSNTAVGSGGSIVFAANNANWSFAAIKGLVSSGGGNSRGDLAFSVRTNTTDSTLSEAMRITSAGLVGIGTTAPVSLLNVKSPLFNTAETVASFGNGTIADGLEIITNGNLDWGFNAKNSRNLTFSTNQTERLRITSGGLVGIGTTVDPVEKLEVNGTIKATDINFTGLATYADDAAAGTGGLVTGDVYKTSTGELRIKV